MRSRPGVSIAFGMFCVLVLALLAGTAAAERPRRLVIPQDGLADAPTEPTGLLQYNTVYLNRCADGCVVRPGSSSSVNDTWGIPSQRTLTAWPYGDASWAEVVACVKDTFSPFMISVVETSPGGANHFEIMIAGRGTDLYSGWTNVGGIAPGSCTTSAVNNALVFAFAKSYGDNTANTCDASCVNDVCSTAAQEIGHVWKSMDHVRLASDPMTYFGFADRRYFQNTDAQCGSDCVDGQGPNGETCSGTNNQSHACICKGVQTQNSYAVVKDLFGLGPGSPPTVKITSPKLGDSVMPGFPIVTDPQDDSGKITKVELKVDGVLVSMLEKGPFVFNAPDTLMNGTHRVEVIAYDPHQTPGSGKVDVIIGPPCKGEDDCSTATDVCVGGRCVPGSGVNGGLGSTCSMSTDCLSNQCASDGTASYCVEQCMVGQCPSDYGCLDVGDGTSVCWPGYDDGSGGCGCQSTRGGPMGLILALLVMVGTCRRRRR